MKKNKTPKEELASFMKSNKKRRVVLAERAGFKNVDDFKTHLKNKVDNPGTVKKTPTKKGNKKITLNHISVLDNSVSMGKTNMKIAKEGLLEDFKANQKDNYQFILFAESVRMLNNNVKLIQSAKATGWSTALISAACAALDEALANVTNTNKYLIKIFTDGLENSSTAFDRSRFGDLVQKAEKKGVTLTFIGPEHTLNELVDRYKVDRSNTLGHDNTEGSIKMSMDMMRGATQSYATKAMAGEDVTYGFYKEVVK